MRRNAATVADRLAHTVRVAQRVRAAAAAALVQQLQPAPCPPSPMQPLGSTGSGFAAVPVSARSGGGGGAHSLPRRRLPARSLGSTTTPLLLHSQSLLRQALQSVPTRQLPTEVLLQVVLHLLVATLWGRSGVDLDVLALQLERNLRRLRALLAELPYAQHLRATGGSSKELAEKRHRLRQAQRRVRVRAPSPAAPATTATTAASGRAPRTLGGRWGGGSSFPATPLALREGSMEAVGFSRLGASPPTPSVPAVPAVHDIQLLQTLELHECLATLPLLQPHAGTAVHAIDSKLLLHGVCNEFADVLFIGSVAERKGAQHRTNVSAL
ncbi:hypothetical protein STCU_11283 [Strigomonas culicis]|uniref:Uncharacterized protein n=1 Tax=Strigomonas culicis TaxID=28005 RepID=S9THN8_9TRYP|nr:hypothetical protein STCU_11283 [Strigomonas culicis]|eukprot:EPY16424.1 hypothetical protein STCU_11283 [Strigomonas culicis]